MATQLPDMTSRPPLKTDSLDDMDSFFDFNQGTTQPSPATQSAASPFNMKQEEPRFNGPSHDYNLFRQQTGLPMGGMPPSMFDGYNSGIGDMSFDAPMNGWATGIDLDADMTVDFNNPQTAMPPMFFPQQQNAHMEDNSTNFVNPNSVGGHEEPVSNVGRLWPGMHSQQAQQQAMHKAAQSQAMQQRQMKMQAQHAQYRQPSVASVSSQQQQQQQHTAAKRSSHAAEPHVEESISRLLNQMRQNAHVSNDDGSQDDLLPHIARMKKDEEDMDEDERLLASEEGKKLSSKERRQLRNKVSARAFRSRRKEYIGQLEGEVAMKTQENNNLRNQNQNLMHENERYRGLIETLLRHPAFTPFINDISKDPAVLGMPPPPQPQQQPQQMAPTPNQQHVQPHQQQQQQQQQQTKPEVPQFDVSKLTVPSQPQNQHINLAMIPENDFSKLNLSGFRNAMSHQSVNAYALTDLPDGPNPAELLYDANDMPISHPVANAAATSNMNLLLAKLEGAARSLDYGRGV